MGGITPKVMGFGNRPLPPQRCLPRHITDFPLSRLFCLFAQYVNRFSVSSRTHSNACFAAFLAMISNSVNGPLVSVSFSRFFRLFLISCSVLMFFTLRYLVRFGSLNEVYVVAELLYISVHYHIINCVHKHKNKLKEVKQKWDIEEEHISISGLAEDHSVTCHHGKDLDVHTAAEDMDKEGTLIRRHVQDFRGFQDGGGQTQHTQISLQRLIHKDELTSLEDFKKELGEEKASIEQEINDIETHLKELKSKLESEKKQPTGQ